MKNFSALFLFINTLFLIPCLMAMESTRLPTQKFAYHCCIPSLESLAILAVPKEHITGVTEYTKALTKHNAAINALQTTPEKPLINSAPLSGIYTKSYPLYCYARIFREEGPYLANPLEALKLRIFSKVLRPRITSKKVKPEGFYDGDFNEEFLHECADNLDCLEHLLSHADLTQNMLDHLVESAPKYPIKPLLIKRHARLDFWKNCHPLISSIAHHAFLKLPFDYRLIRNSNDISTVFRFAASYSAVDTLQEIAFLASQMALQLSQNDKDGALRLAIETKSTAATLNTLIKLGANIHYVDKHGKSPLHYAAQNNNYEAAEILLNEGANVEVQDLSKNTPLLCFKYNSKSRFPEKDTSELAKLLLRHGAPVDAKNIYGCTPLSTAVRNEDLNTIQLLLDRGAEVSFDLLEYHLWRSANYFITQLLIHNKPLPRQEKTDSTLLHVIAGLSPLCGQKYYDNLQKSALVLIAAGADVNAQDCYGQTPLHRAALENHPDVTLMTQFLLDHGALQTITTHNRETPLHLCKTLSIAQLLIKHGGNVHAQDNQGRTPLHSIHIRTDVYSVRESIKRQLERAQLLINAGADINAQDNNGKTPLYVAQLRGDHDFEKFLLAHGADGHISTQQKKELH